MRTFWIALAAGAAILLSAASLRAGGPACAAPACAAPAPTCAAPEPTCEALAAVGCDPCGDRCGRGRGCGLLNRLCGGGGSAYEGLDSHFNCGCNGSYKFPVPPLYTYHWPGMYQQHLMTDYHSPWRFPPLKPYVDEVPPVEMGAIDGPAKVQTASALFEIASRKPGEMESMSSKMLRSR